MYNYTVEKLWGSISWVSSLCKRPCQHYSPECRSRQSPFPETCKETERLVRSPSQGGFLSMRVDSSATSTDKKGSLHHEVVHIQIMMYTYTLCIHTHSSLSVGSLMTTQSCLPRILARGRYTITKSQQHLGRCVPLLWEFPSWSFSSSSSCCEHVIIRSSLCITSCQPHSPECRHRQTPFLPETYRGTCALPREG